MRFLVTGGAGFIGSNIVETLLAMDGEVTVLDNLSTGKRSNIEPFMGNPLFHLHRGGRSPIPAVMRPCLPGNGLCIPRGGAHQRAALHRRTRANP